MSFTPFKFKKMVTVAAASGLIAAFLITSGFSFMSMKRDMEIMEVQSPKLPFSDIKGHWAEAGIVEMYGRGVMKGYKNETFKPKHSVTKLEAVVALDRLLGYKADEDKASFDYLGELFDIPEWALGYVGIALKNDLLFYGELGTLSNQQPLSRQDAAVLAVRALKLSRQARQSEDAELSFTDLEQVDPVKKNYVRLACDLKIMSGFPDGEFQPFAPVSRAELAVILSRISEQRPQRGEISGRIKAINQTENLITLTNNDGREFSVKFNDSALIYADGKSAAFDKLSPGSFLTVINSNPEATILISRTLKQDEATPVPLRVLNSSMIPGDLIQWVETNKAFPNCLTKIVRDKMYILVSLGEKMTGGYAVDVSEISSTVDSRGKVNYEVTVLWVEPEADAIVNQVISYPYTVVEIDAPKLPLGTIKFVDTADNTLAE